MIEEKGPWYAAFSNDKAFIESDDFTHDVRLYVSGDFESVEQKVEYAEEIARRLNTFASYDAEIAELVAALESVEWTQLGEMPEGKHCCYCGALEKHGHVTGCKVAISLKRTTLAQALSKLRKP